jgi:eukaryotic-like serine/threonine-protein kinase
MAATTEAGRMLAGGRYRVDRLLGAGGMATVWLAYDERLARPVAIKEMAPVLAEDERFVARFRHEARIAASLSHANLVRVFDFAVDDGRPFVVMEHVPGGTLAERLNRGQAVGDCIGLARALLEALDHIHGAGIVHRDLKPANILIDADEAPKITDFGIAHSLGSGRQTRAGHAIGTARFLAPEVRAGAPSSPASDLYGLGVLLRECTRGTGPEPLERLVDALAAEDPTERPGSAAAALRRLDGETGEVPLVDLARTVAGRSRGGPPIAAADPGASLAASATIAARRFARDGGAPAPANGAKAARGEASASPGKPASRSVTKAPVERPARRSAAAPARRSNARPSASHRATVRAVRHSAARRPADAPRYAPGPRRVAVTLLLLVATAAALTGLAATGGDPRPQSAPAAAPAAKAGDSGTKGSPDAASATNSGDSAAKPRSSAAPTPTPARGAAEDVGRSLDRIERIVRAARER